LGAGLSALSPAWAQAPASTIPAELGTAISRTLRSIEPAGAGHYTALNPDNRMALNFDGDGLEVAPGGKRNDDWHWTLRLSGYGVPGRVKPAEKAAVVTSKQRLEYRRGAVIEWYENRPEGLEQGFTLAQPPEAGATTVELRLGTGGGLKAGIEPGGKTARFRDKSGQEVLAYRDLSVIDAKGKALPAHLALAGDQLAIEVDTRGAAWPVTVDPLIVSIQQKLIAQKNDGSDDSQHDGLFGGAAALSGDTALVGSIFAGDTGAAYVYVRDGSGWHIQQKILAQNTDGNDDNQLDAMFGTSVAVDGDTAVVGAIRSNCVAGTHCGAAYVYVRNGVTWSIQQKLVAQNTGGSDDSQTDASFGTSVAVDGDTVLVGSSLRNCMAGARCGAVYVYVRSGAWNVQQKLLAQADDGSSDEQGDAYFGEEVALSGNKALVGAYNKTCSAGELCGAAYIYSRNGTVWDIQQKLLAQNGDGSPDVEHGAAFGASVALSSNTALIGAQFRSCNAGTSCGAAYAYTFGGTAWAIQQKLQAKNADGSDDTQSEAYFGHSVALSSDVAVIGANAFGTAAVPVSGAAYAYARTGTDWSIQRKFLAQNTDGSDDSQGYATFGQTVSLDGRNVVVGAVGQSCAPGSYCGAAYIYTLQYALTVTNAGGGTVASNPAGIDCGSTCSADFAKDAAVTLTASPEAGYAFSGWSGCDSSVGDTCQVTMNQAKAVTASFVPVAPTYNLSVLKSGKGKVTSAPAGIDCGPACQGGFAQDSVVTLTATAAPKYLFLGWSGPCMLKVQVQGWTELPQLLCEVTLNKSKQVKAKFVKVLP